MLVSAKEMLNKARAEHYAVGQFNINNLEWTKAILLTAEELKSPVILGVSEGAGKYMCGYSTVVGMVNGMLENLKITVPVALHLDHCNSLEHLREALESGFTSVMYDGSTLDAKLNCANTCVARELADRFGASLEAEIGSMGARESGAAGGSDESIYTDPEDAKKFVEETGIDALACAFGTAHGVYLKAPKLDFDRLAKIRSLVNVPLVMHGGSGVSEEGYRKVIELGIRKINYYTYMAKAGANAIAAMKDMTYFHDIEMVAIAAMKEDAKQAMTVFSGR